MLWGKFLFHSKQNLYNADKYEHIS